MASDPSNGASETLVSEGDDPGLSMDAPRSSLARGTTVGRYVILGRLGAGGMGVVYEAYDPELDRRVAIKILRQRGSPSERGQQRLLREAQALARLSHPNVVAVHDAGTFSGQVFLAMEFIRGEDLGEWLAAGHGWHEVVEVFVEAAKGLAAAHRAGLVHRDFKPDNVMLAEDGRPRVMDFGLARLHGETDVGESRDPITSSDGDPVGPSSGGLASSLTVTGALMGTPAYMSPEQHAGLPTDARTDQFSFCVALYEGLYGERPFRGETLMQLGIAVSEGVVASPPRDTEVPTWIRKVVLRGLAATPGDRWPDMDELVAALRDDPTVARRRRRGVAAAVLGALAVLGVGGWSLMARTTQDVAGARCEDAMSRLAGTWDPARRDGVRSAMVAADLAFAEDTAERVVAGLDEYATRWASSYADACRATWVRGEQSEALLDARMACLAQRREALSYVVDLLDEADEDVAVSASRAVANLPAIAPCDDVTSLRDGIAPPLDAAQAESVAEIRSSLARARALGSAGRIDDAVAAAEDAGLRAEASDYGPVQAEAQATLGSLLIEAGRFDVADAHLERGYYLATEVGHDRVAAEAAAELIYVVGYKLAAHARGEDWSRHAFAVAKRLGEDTVQEASAAHYAGVLADATGRHPQALTSYERALELRRRHLGERHPDTARTMNNIGNVYLSTGDYARAEAHYRDAMRLREEIFGPRHPEMTGSLNNLALVLRRRGDLEASGRMLERAIEIVEDSYGPDHASLAQYLDNLATVRRLSENFDEAIALDQRALALRLQHFGASHPDVGDPLAGLGATFEAKGELQAALEHFERAQTLYEKAFGDDHPIVVSTRVAIARVLVAQGTDERAAALLEQTLGQDTPAGAEPVDVAEGRFLLARLLGRARDPVQIDRARSLAERAKSAYTEAGTGYEARVEEIDAWLNDQVVPAP